VISMRYHLVSIAAVLLALGVGVVLGSTTLSRTLLSGLSSDNADLGRNLNQAEAERDALRTKLADADSFAQSVGASAVRGQLDKRTVMLVTTVDTKPTERDAVSSLITAAGATVTGEVQLTDAFTDPQRSDQLKDIVTRLLPAGVQLPTATDPGTLAGGLLGPLVLISKENNKPQASADERAAALAGLAEGGFVRVGPDLAPGQLVVVMAGGAAQGDGAGDRAATVARLAIQLDQSGAGAVLAGPATSADGTGALGVVRADTAATSLLSTVDNLDTAAGQVVTVLALREQLEGESGRYGTAANAQSPAPGAPAE